MTNATTDTLARDRKKAMLRVLLNAVHQLDDATFIRRFALKAADRGIPPELVVRVVQAGFRKHIRVAVSAGDLVRVASIFHRAIECGVPKSYLQTQFRIAMNAEFGPYLRVS